ncbi:MAG TPA: IS91 family transposase [Pyrinomonadaceae bacterium]|nr:IS91 family transposase [Pyrinomonadaceae bacterium]
MLELAEIFRLHGPAYREKFGDRMLPSHHRAMQDIETCRTESLGGQLYYCAQCDVQRYSYHSCKNRHCPKCQNQQANDWLAAQQSLLLPVTHFLVTFTLPDELRALARSNQKTIYNLLFRASSQALQQLALDPRFVGGRIGMVGVLHTWTRQLLYHPHVHFIVTGGGLTEAGSWKSARADFLVPVKALSRIFRAKFRDQLKQTQLFAAVAPRVWRKDWVVHSEPVGSGQQAFQYLAPYIFRVALSNNRLRNLHDGQVTFSYKESATDQLKHCTITAHEFIRRFLQHVLPNRFIKVRYYGLLSPAHRQLLEKARQLLTATTSKLKSETVKTTEPGALLSCPHCGGPLTLLGPLAPRGRSP